MNPFVMFLLAILSPLLLAIALLVPSYAGIGTAAYVIYAKTEGPHPLDDKLTDVFYIVDVYTNLFTNWLQHMGDYSIFLYAVPLLVAPLLGVALSLWLTAKLARKLMDIFQLGVQH